VYTSGGNISEHSTGDAMDIAEINGIPILGNQGRGSITEAVVQSLLRLQGNMEPHQLITLMDLGGPSFSMADHADHIHVGYHPRGQAPGAQKRFVQLLKPDQWRRLIGRIAEIDNPKVPTSPSRYSIPAGKRKHPNRASAAHRGD
jgi:hypothetical protein